MKHVGCIKDVWYHFLNQVVADWFDSPECQATGGHILRMHDMCVGSGGVDMILLESGRKQTLFRYLVMQAPKPLPP